MSPTALVQRLAEARVQVKSATGGDVKSLESAFVKIAKQFSANRSINYGA